MNGIQIVLFDLGGVLVELTGVSMFNSWLRKQLTPEEVWERWLSSPAVRAFETGAIGADQFADQLILEFDLSPAKMELLAAFTGWPRLVPGAADLVRRVGERCVCATLCNTNVLHWQRFVDEMGVEQLFAHRFASHLIGKLKPDRDVFEHVIAALQCEPAAIVFIDDQPMNVESARRCGMIALQARGLEETERALQSVGVLD